jgi:hypothetical protein
MEKHKLVLIQHLPPARQRCDLESFKLIQKAAGFPAVSLFAMLVFG